MTICKFELGYGKWRRAELATILEALTPLFTKGHASAWDAAKTDRSEPQFYLLGPLPGQECILCISRIGETYIVEDGEGRLIADCGNMQMLGAQLRGIFGQGAMRMIAKLLACWCGAKQFVHDTAEPLVEEGEALLSHLTPQLAAMV